MNFGELGKRLGVLVLAALVTSACGLATAADLDTARSLMAQGEYSEAVIELDRYLASNPESTEARFLRGLAQANGDNKQAAIKTFRNLTNEHPDMAEAWNNLGVLYAEQEDYEQAREALEKAVSLDPKHGPAQENLGDVYVAMARTAYDTAADVEQQNVVVRAKRQRLQALLDSPRPTELVPAKGALPERREPEPASSPESAEAPRTPSAGSPGAQQDAGARPEVLSPAAAGAQAEADEHPQPASSAQTAAVSSQTSGSTSARGAVVDVVREWARAWAQQDVPAYLASYSQQFAPEDGSSRSAWARDRRERVTAPRYIELELTDISLEVSGERALISFLQRYSSGNYRDEERKALLLGRESGGWKILREATPSALRGALQAPRQAEQAPSAPSAPADAGNEQAAKQQIESIVYDWARAWSEQELAAYFDAYSNAFDPEGDQTLKQWVIERRQRVSEPRFIQVDVSDLDISLIEPDRAQVTFRQQYQSDGFRDTGRKTLELWRESEGWKIVSERGN